VEVLPDTGRLRSCLHLSVAGSAAYSLFPGNKRPRYQ